MKRLGVVLYASIICLSIFCCTISVSADENVQLRSWVVCPRCRAEVRNEQYEEKIATAEVPCKNGIKDSNGNLFHDFAYEVFWVDRWYCVNPSCDFEPTSRTRLGSFTVCLHEGSITPGH